MLSIESTVGAPTSFAMKPKLQFSMPNTKGYQYITARWFDLSAEQLTAHVVKGINFPTLTATGTWTRTILRPPQRMRLDLGEAGPDQLTFAGGTNPGLKLSLMGFTKG